MGGKSGKSRPGGSENRRADSAAYAAAEAADGCAEADAHLAAKAGKAASGRGRAGAGRGRGRGGSRAAAAAAAAADENADDAEDELHNGSEEEPEPEPDVDAAQPARAAAAAAARPPKPYEAHVAVYVEEKQIPSVWAKYVYVAATNGATSSRAMHHLETLLNLVTTCILKATGDASTDDPADEEKEAKWSAVKAQIEEASANASM